jgi:hypothetical protein
MIKEYIIETLKKIKEIDEKVHILYDHGVDIIELENGVHQLEKSISVILREKEDQQFRYIQDLVGWWLYEKGEKIMWHDEDSKQDLSDIETFVDYLITEYGKNADCSL